jgi:hypothetical protein
MGCTANTSVISTHFRLRRTIELCLRLRTFQTPQNIGLQYLQWLWWCVIWVYRIAASGQHVYSAHFEWRCRDDCNWCVSTSCQHPLRSSGQPQNVSEVIIEYVNRLPVQQIDEQYGMWIVCKMSVGNVPRIRWRCWQTDMKSLHSVAVGAELWAGYVSCGSLVRLVMVIMAKNPQSQSTLLLWGCGMFVNCTVCVFTLHLQWQQTHSCPSRPCARIHYNWE